MEIVLLIAGLIFSAFGAFVLRDELHFRKHAYQDTGHVIAIETSRGSKGGTMYAPVIQYEYQGQTQQFTARISSSNCSYNVGDSIDIMIMDGQPPQARLHSKGMLWFSGLFLAIGVGCCIGFFFAFEPNLFSVGIAAFILISLSIQAAFKLKKHHIYSLEDFKRKINEAKHQHNTVTTTPNTSTTTPSKQRIYSNKQLKKQKQTTPVVVIILLALISLGLGAGSLYMGTERWTFLQLAESTDGKVVDFERHTSTSDGKTSTTYAPIIEFIPKETQTAIKFTDDFSSSSPSEKRGDQVTVLYLSDDPSEAIMDKGWLNWFGPGLLSFMAIITTLITISLIGRNRKLKKQQQQDAAELEF